MWRDLKKERMYEGINEIHIEIKKEKLKKERSLENMMKENKKLTNKYKLMRQKQWM